MNVIISPEQIVLVVVGIVTDGTSVGFTVIITGFEVITLGLAQPDELVNSTV